MQFRLLGGLAVEDDHGAHVELGGPKQRSVLAALLLAGGRPVPTDVLIDRVWGDHAPPRAETSIQAYISNLRRALEPHRGRRAPAEVLVSRPAGYAIGSGAEQIDLIAYEQAVSDLHSAMERGDIGEALHLAERAEAWWAGPLLPEFDEPWITERAALLEATRLRARSLQVEALLAAGWPERAAQVIAAPLAEHPYEEHLYALAARAQYQLGNQREALATIHRARERLLDEIGIDLGPELRQVERDILDQAEHLAPASRRLIERRGEDPQPADSPARFAEPPSAAASRSSAASLASVAGPFAGPATTQVGDVSSPGFYGRAVERERLDSVWSRANAGEGQVVVISGEPGAGKTRLVEQFIADHPGVAVVWGRCPESAAQSPYAVVSQIIRQLEGAGLVELGAVVEAPGDDEDAGEWRVRLYQNVSRTLARLHLPVVIVLDDLHWADTASLRLIEYVAGDVCLSSALVLITCRRGYEHPELASCLAELSRHPNMATLPLAGLSEAEVARWLEDSTGVEPTPVVVDDIVGRTAGNPYFVREVVAHLAAGSSYRRLPDGVHDAVRRHTAQLPPETQSLLAVACVIGREFDSLILADIAGASQLGVIDTLGAAVGRGLIEPSDGPGLFRFTHAIIAEAIGALVLPARRAEVHAAAARAMVGRGRADIEEQLPLVVHHAVGGMACGTAELAFELSRRAAALARMRFSDEEAVAYWRHALDALAAMPHADPSLRQDTSIELGHALMRLDDVGGAVAVLLPVARAALAAGDVDRAVRAAIAHVGQTLWHAGELVAVAADVTDMLHRVLSAMPVEDSADRVLVLAAAEEYGYWVTSADLLAEMADETVAISARLGDANLLVRSLIRRMQRPGPSRSNVRRQADTAELATLTRRVALPSTTRARALFQLSSAAFNSSEVTAAERHITEARRLVRRHGPLDIQMFFTTHALTLWRGELERALEMIDEAEEGVRRSKTWAANLTLHNHLAFTLVELDRLDEADQVLGAIGDTPYTGPLHLGRMWIRSQGPRFDVSEIPEVFPPVESWLSVPMDALSLYMRVEHGVLDDVDELVRRLEPHAGDIAVVGAGMGMGDVDTALAAGYHALGQRSRAAEAIVRGVDNLRRNGAGPWLGRALALQARIGESEHPLGEARLLADRLQLPLLRRQLGAA